MSTIQLTFFLYCGIMVYIEKEIIYASITVNAWRNGMW